MSLTLSYLYGTLLIAGGAAGAAKAGSTASLIAGGGSGAAVIALEYLFSTPGAARGSSVVAAAELTIAAALTYSMGQRFAASGKVMPAGLVAGMSAVMVIAYAARFFGVGGRAHNA